MTAITAQQTDTLLDALRSNLSLLGELAMRYAGGDQAGARHGDLPSIRSPRGRATTCWGRRCRSSPRSSCGCCC